MRTALVLALALAACKDRAPAARVTPSASAIAASSGVTSAVYDDPRSALRAVLARGPLVLAVGEAHAQRGVAGAGVSSSAKRFAEEMLPELSGKASDLVLELMAPPSGCEAKTEVVRKEMNAVTAPQAETNQSEYVALGDAAQKLGIEPHLLHPSCDDMRAVAALAVDGGDTTEASLRLIARLLGETAQKALARNRSKGDSRMVMVYGGALHNDAHPSREIADLAYGPRLLDLAGARYVELDVFVPELVRDGGLWRTFPWYAHYDRAAHPERATLFAMGASSFALILPAARP